jgi:hypothetical protein
MPPRDQSWWELQVDRRVHVRTAETLTARDYHKDAQKARRAGVTGRCLSYSNEGHGLTIQIELADGSTSWYDPDELTVLDQ